MDIPMALLFANITLPDFSIIQWLAAAVMGIILSYIYVPKWSDNEPRKRLVAFIGWITAVTLFVVTGPNVIGSIGIIMAGTLLWVEGNRKRLWFR